MGICTDFPLGRERHEPVAEPTRRVVHTKLAEIEPVFDRPAALRTQVQRL